MRKSLATSARSCREEHIDEIVRLYGEFAEDEQVKIFDNEDFGFRRITVERPLRLNFQASPERIERLKDETAFQNLAPVEEEGDGRRAGGRGRADAAGRDPRGARDARRRPALEEPRRSSRTALDAALKAGRAGRPPRSARRSCRPSSERDETRRDLHATRTGNPEPDADLRDYENVPLKEDIQTYFEREVLPHVPDAWIDETKTKVGYEIPFTRHFYMYKPPRPLAEIEAEIRTLEDEIQGMLGEVLR